jgi:hypothetical protein
MRVMGPLRLLQKLLVLVAALVLANAARAQIAYPSHPIQLVVTVPPGGAADFVARIIGAKLADALGQPLIVANRGGAAGTTAAASVAKSDGDGYTLLLNTIATHGMGPHLYANLPYDPAKDFAPVILLARFPLIMTVSATLPDPIGRRGDCICGRVPECSASRRPAPARAPPCRRAVQARGRDRALARALPRQRRG